MVAESTNWFTATFLLWYVGFAVLIPGAFIFGFSVFRDWFFLVVGAVVVGSVMVVERLNPEEKARRGRKGGRQVVTD